MPTKFQQPTKKQIQFAAGMHTKQFKGYDKDTQKFFACFAILLCRAMLCYAAAMFWQ